jgi:hypothetical protein
MQGGGQHLLSKAGQPPAHSYLSSYPYLFVRLEGRIHKRNNKLNGKIMSSVKILTAFSSIFQTKYLQEAVFASARFFLSISWGILAYFGRHIVGNNKLASRKFLA